MKSENTVELNIFRKIAKVFFRILYNLLTILCVILICIIVMQRVTDSNGSIAGYRIFRVISGSMIPRYDIGEVVICKEIPSDDIKIGDAIVYRGKDGELNGKLIMHEVIAKNYDENNNLTITAKGLLNGMEDPDISENEVLGVVIFTSRILTSLYVLATSTYSAFIIIFILAINVFFSFKSSTRNIESRHKVKQLETNNEEYEEYEDEEDNLEEEYFEDENDDIDESNENDSNEFDNQDENSEE